MPAAVSFEDVHGNTTYRIRLLWEQIGGASSYQIWMRADKKEAFEIVKTITDTTTSSYTVKDLPSGKAMEFQMRSYTEVNGKKTFSKDGDVVFVTVR